jgi:hypothetical protein
MGIVGVQHAWRRSEEEEHPPPPPGWLIAVNSEAGAPISSQSNGPRGGGRLWTSCPLQESRSKALCKCAYPRAPAMGTAGANAPVPRQCALPQHPRGSLKYLQMRLYPTRAAAAFLSMSSTQSICCLLISSGLPRF